MQPRKRTARLRETFITLACRFLRIVFSFLDFIEARISSGPGSRSRQTTIVNPSGLPEGARVAIIKPCCLGDVALATPVIKVINEARPDLQLEFVVSEWSRPVVEHNPRLKTLVATGFEGSVISLKQYFRLVRRLREQKYSAALVLDRSPLLALLPWLAGIKLRAGLDSRGRGFALNRRAQLEASDPPRHEAEIYLSVAKAAGFEIARARGEFYPGETARLSFEQKARELGVDFSKPLAVIHPGGGHNPDTVVLSKRWPAENFGEIARQLLQSGAQVIVTGAQSDRELAKKVIEVAGPSPYLFNAAERFNIAENGGLFEQAGLFVGNDTGLMHVAAACGTCVVAIFGPSSPVAYGPFTAQGRAVSPLRQFAPEGLPLSEYQALSAAQGGIMAVTVAQVWEAVQAFLPVQLRQGTQARQEVEVDREH